MKSHDSLVFSNHLVTNILCWTANLGQCQLSLLTLATEYMFPLRFLMILSLNFLLSDLQARTYPQIFLVLIRILYEGIEKDVPKFFYLFCPCRFRRYDRSSGMFVLLGPRCSLSRWIVYRMIHPLNYGRPMTLLSYWVSSLWHSQARTYRPLGCEFKALAKEFFGCFVFFVFTASAEVFKLYVQSPGMFSRNDTNNALGKLKHERCVFDLIGARFYLLIV